ncbi:Aspartyl protease [Singulisphaera sp. GP187]|uniref:retroviral-like aspartic protease family protein n=1 Tax=Singulisphaera sp. GP187 TaxID=1882752 RepID=UPI0009261831|nr:retroviral-like aspartic protease family protein [Singulisphaera sp. GP187]SIO65518.1 Aspartyl protease [Singulisphaera sp. GP187]
MPNLTVTVGAGQAPILELIVGPTEATIEALRAAGEPIPLPILVPAMLDTGAGTSLLARRIAEKLGLDPGGERIVIGVGSEGTETGVVYRIRLAFPAVPPMLLASTVCVVAVEDLAKFDVGMILGRDLLSRCVLLYNGPDGRCTFAF